MTANPTTGDAHAYRRHAREVAGLLGQADSWALTTDGRDELDRLLSRIAEAVAARSAGAMLVAKGDLVMLTVERRFGGIGEEPAAPASAAPLERISDLVHQLLHDDPAEPKSAPRDLENGGRNAVDER